MQYITEAYRNMLATPFRGDSHVWICLGVINNDAQRNAKITSSFTGDESQLYLNNDPTSYMGVVSSESDGSITFTFDGFYQLDIAGLTLHFGNTVPSSLTVTNGSKTETYTVSGQEYVIDDGYRNCHYMKITPDSGQLSLKSILFGIGLQFTDKQLINTKRENSVDHISNELPKKEFNFTIDNRSHLFCKDNPFGYADYIEEKQKIKYEYGREMPDGSMFKIKGGIVYLKKWSSNDYEAKFTCVGKLEYLDTQYYKGQYRPNGISAYDLAVSVFADAGVTEYIVDSILRNYIVYNPIPVCTHREALQYIANATCCILYEDRDGNICISNADKPSYIESVEFVGATDYSTESTLFNDNSAYNYADAEAHYTEADGALYLLPESNSYLDVGYVSDELARSDETFSSEKSIYTKFESEYRLSQMILNFGVICPKEINVICYCKGTAVLSVNLTTALTLSTIVPVNKTIDAIRIEFIKAKQNQRIHLNNVYLDGFLNYELTYHELKEPPIADSLERVSKINVHAYTYGRDAKGIYDTSITRTDIQDGYGGMVTTFTVVQGTGDARVTRNDSVNSAGGITTDIQAEYVDNQIATISAVIGENLIIFKDPYYGLRVSEGTIIESGTYYCKVVVDHPCEIVVYGSPYSVTDNIYSIDIHEKGVEKSSSNVLIGSSGQAIRQAEWLRDYFDDDIEYNLTYRGDPMLDADDLIYLENHYVDKNEIRISQETISTSMGTDFSCKIIARRTSFIVDGVVGRAIVGRSKVGEVVNELH